MEHRSIGGNKTVNIEALVVFS